MNKNENSDFMKESKFEKIDNELRKEIESEYYSTMLEMFRVEKMDDGYHKYQFGHEEDIYIRYVTNNELREAIKLAIDMLEEMKIINNSGVNRTELNRILEKEKAREENEYLHRLYAFERIKTDRLKNIIKEIDKVARVAGTWALIVGNPSLCYVAYGVYDKLVDDFDNEEWYWKCGFYLVQAIMRMYGNEK